MIANILIAIGFLGIGFFSGMLYAANLVGTCYRKDKVRTILVLENYKNKYNKVYDQN